MKELANMEEGTRELSRIGEDICSQLEYLSDALQAQVDLELKAESTTHPANWQMIAVLNPVLRLLRSVSLSVDEQISDLRYEIDQLQKQGRNLEPA